MNNIRPVTLRGRGLLLAAVATAMTAASIGAATAQAATPTLTGKIEHGGRTKIQAVTTTLSALGQHWNCVAAGKTPAATGTAVIPAGRKHGPAPLEIGVVKTLSLSDCTGPAGKASVRAGGLPYGIKVNSRTTAKGQTDVLVTGVSLSVSTGNCRFTASGSLPGYYTNKTRTVTLTPGTLPAKPLTAASPTISNVKGCSRFGAVARGHHGWGWWIPVVVIVALWILFP
jgi:hypothetical protein